MADRLTGRPLRVGLDATPLLGTLTGVGMYTRELLRRLGPPDGGPGLDLVATAFTLRGRARLAGALPAGVAARSRPVPARLLRTSWQRSEFPPVEWLCGRVEVFHATNFVLPPLRRARGVVTVHDLSFLRYPHTVSADSLRYRELVPRSVARARVVCTLTEAMADEVADEYRIGRDRIQVTPPGVDAAWFDALPPEAATRRRIGLPERYVLAVGTLEPRKNLPALVAAYRALLADDPGTPPLVLAGPAGWGTALDLSGFSPGAVLTTDYLDTATLRSVVAGASCVAYPSLYEGFGLPPVEALACGVPVVATDLAVTREVLGPAAQLVAAGDVDGLATALARAVDEPRDEARRATRRAQAARWTWDSCAAATRIAYRRAAG